MFRELVDHVVAEMRDDINDVLHDNQMTPNEKRGRIGELLIGRSMKYILLEYETYLPRGEPCHFWIQPQYGADGERRGVDFRLDIRDAQNVVHTFLVESKNLMDDYPLTPATFNDEILTRFTPYDDGHQWTWVVTLNHRHIEDIGQLCRENRIEIVPLDVVLSTDPDIEELTEAVRAFTTHFTELIERYVDLRQCITNEPLTIFTLVHKGVPERVIARFLGRDLGYIAKVKSTWKKKGGHPVDRRIKEGKNIRNV